MPKARRAPKESNIAKPFAKLVNIIGWVTMVIVAFAVGFSMINGTLTVPWIGFVVPYAGWIVVILTIVGVIMALVDALSK